MNPRPWCLVFGGLLVLLVTSFTALTFGQTSPVSVTWHGHANFTIACAPKFRMVIDPFTPGSSVVAVYKTPVLEGEVVLVTHEHFDHNNVSAVGGNPTVLRGSGLKEVGPVKFQGVPSYHDDKQGQERGFNTIFRWECAGVSFAHLGDLGQKKLTPEQLNKVAGVDVLFLPVGGTFTIGPKEAGDIVEQIKPRIVVPMHYKVIDAPANNPLGRVDQFLKGKKNVKYLDANSFTVSKETLPPEREIWVPQVKGLLK